MISPVNWLQGLVHFRVSYFTNTPCLGFRLATVTTSKGNCSAQENVIMTLDKYNAWQLLCYGNRNMHLLPISITSSLSLEPAQPWTCWQFKWIIQCIINVLDKIFMNEHMYSIDEIKVKCWSCLWTFYSLWLNTSRSSSLIALKHRYWLGTKDLYWDRWLTWLKLRDRA